MLVDYLHEIYLKFCSITELLVVSDTLFTNKRDKLVYSMVLHVTMVRSV